MSLAFVPPKRGYILYIDEAGDPGLAKVRPLDPDGSSEWLVIGGVLTKADRESEAVGWVRSIRQKMPGAQRPDLHFRLLTATRKLAVCNEVAGLPLRAFVVASNKKNMRGYRNRRAEEARPSTQEWFYNFCVRLLLERVTDYVERRSRRDYGELRHLEVVFSNRGGMRYGQTKAYYDLLQAQARAGLTRLTKRVVKWQVLHPRLVRSVGHTENAGVQLADVVASAFYQAADALGPGQWSTRYAEALRKVMCIEKDGRRLDYGVVLQPTPPLAAKLSPEQRKIFEFYGYSFE